MILVKVQSAYNDDNWNYKPSNVFACLQLVETHHMIENTQAKKWGVYQERSVRLKFNSR